MTTTLIQKEEIPHYTCLKCENILSDEEKVNRKIKLQRGQILGNAYKSKVKIVFYTAHGLKAVETTTWTVGDEYIVLKGGVTIPLDSIMDIEL
jgi:hypothetical protein